MEVVGETAEQILSKGPLAVRFAKLAVHAGYETDRRTGLLIERLARRPSCSPARTSGRARAPSSRSASQSSEGGRR